MAGKPIVHIEMASRDPEAAGKFYGQLFGWEIEGTPIPGMEDQTYWQFGTDSGPGGAFPAADGQMFNPGDVLVYISSDDIEADLAKAESLGGQTLTPKTEIPGFGWFAVLSDPYGGKVALWTSTGDQ